MPEKFSDFSSGFPVPSTDQWIALVEKTLKGKPFTAVMQRETHDGIIIDALGTKYPGDAKGQPVRPHGAWAIASPNWGCDAAAVNKDILIDLERGASAIELTLDTIGPVGVSPDQLAVALEGVYLDMLPLNLIQGEDFEAGVNAYEKLARKRGHSKDALSGSLGVNPIGTLARTGRLQTTAEEAIAAGAEIAARWAKQQPAVATFNADGTVFGNAGATEGTEIAAAVSAAIHYMRSMEQAGLSLKDAATQIQFSFSATSELWLTIAKFRAARRVWANVLSACGVERVPMKINGISAVSEITMIDPWVNILRGTAACLGAAVGGADIITTFPHDRAYGDSNNFSRRIARNIQIILMEESHLARVSDPAAGSFALEKLTDDLTEKSANLLGELEASGGILANLRSGLLLNTISETAVKRNTKVRKREIGITGVSEFPNIHEELLASPGNIFTINPKNLPPAGEQITALSVSKLAHEFEALRLESDYLADENGVRPQIALINLGTAADYTARAAFSKNFFEAGGIEAIACPGSESIKDAVAAYSASGANLAVICGTDRYYNEVGTELARALKRVECVRLYLAGKPESANAIETAGVDECIYQGCDVIEALKRAYSALELNADRGAL